MKWLLDFLKGKWLGHPLHPILAHVPMAMWPGALICDLLSQCQIGGNAMVRLSFYAIIFGLAAALLAAPTGLVDWSGIKKEKPAWKIGLYHMSLNLIVTLLFAVDLYLRWPTFREATEVDQIPPLLSAVGTLIIDSANTGPKSGRGLPHSKSWRRFENGPYFAKRLGVRPSSPFWGTVSLNFLFSVSWQPAAP
jgi:uncharacterized membrane protein